MVSNGEKAVATASVTFPWGGLLFIVLFILKVNPGGYLDSAVEGWSWWWIFAPIWGPFALIVVFLAIVLLVALADILVVDSFKSRRNRKAAKQRREAMARRSLGR